MNILKDLNENHGIIFNEQQQLALNHGEGPALVLAVPGSGKTTVLLARTAHLIHEGKAKAEQILSVTFSRASATDMQERYKKLFSKSALGDVKFSTIHALAYGIVMSHGKSQSIQYQLIEGASYNGYTKARLIREIYLKINEGYLSETEYETLVTSISYVKNHMKTSELVDRVNSNLRLEGIDNFKEILDAYEKFKDENHMIDFDDMLVLCHKILENEASIRQIYQDKYTYIQVDEAQDTSLIQHKIIHLIAGDKANVFYVADDDQSIYGFRGASPDYLLNIEDTYATTEIYRLETNFRSTQAIVKLSNGFIKTNGNRYNKEMITENPVGTDVALVTDGDVRTHYEFIIEAIIRSEVYSNNAILYRNNNSALVAAQMLQSKGIPYCVKGYNNRFFEHWIVRDIMAIMDFAIEPTSAEAFTAIYYKLKGYYISKAMLSQIDGKEWDKSVCQRMLHYSHLDKRQNNNVIRLEQDLTTIASMTPEDAIDYILDQMGYREYLVDRGVDGVGASIGDNPMIITLRLLSLDTADVTSLKDNLNELKAHMQLSKDNKDVNTVTLSTIHGAKGLEWDNVYIVDLSNGIFPSNQSLNSETMEDLEEERRIFYVGMTRAQKHLALFGNKDASKFLDEVTRLLNSNRTKKKVVAEDVYVPNYTDGSLDALISSRTTDVLMPHLDKGMTIEHVKLGKGVVISYDHPMIVIDFNGIERKLNYEFCSAQGLLKL